MRCSAPAAPPPARGMRLRTGLAAVTASSLILGVAEVTTPVLWWLTPVAVCAGMRARAGLLVAAWSAGLIAVLIAVPFVPGHRVDPPAFCVLGGLVLGIVGVVWWRESPPPRPSPGLAEHRRVPLGSGAWEQYEELPTVGTVRSALCAGTGAAQLAVHAGYDGALRVMVGELQGELPSVHSVRQSALAAFTESANRTDAGLLDVARAVDAAVHGAAAAGHLSAVLVEITRNGVHLLSCGGPPPVLALPDGVIRELAAGGWPLGCGTLGVNEVVPVPGPGLLAVVSDAVPRAFMFTTFSKHALAVAAAEMLRERSGHVEPDVAAVVLANLTADGPAGSRTAALAIAVPAE